METNELTTDNESDVFSLTLTKADLFAMAKLANKSNEKSVIMQMTLSNKTCSGDMTVIVYPTSEKAEESIQGE